MRCPRCAQDVPDTAKVCGYCGHVFRQSVAQQSSQPQPPAPRRAVPGWIWGVLAAVIVLVLAAVAAVYLLPGLLRPPATEPALPAPLSTSGNQPAASTEAPSVVPSATSLPVSGIVFEPWQDGVGTFIGDLAAGDGNQWTAGFPSNTKVVLHWAWCAKSAELLEQNLAHIQIQFFADDVDVTPQFTSFQGDSEDWKCMFYRGTVKSWSVGQHVIYYKMTFLEKINDGDQDYEGVNSRTYNITVTP